MVTQTLSKKGSALATAAAALLLSPASSSPVTPSALKDQAIHAKAKSEFMSSMRQAEAQYDTKLRRKADRKARERRFQRNLMAKAVPVSNRPTAEDVMAPATPFERDVVAAVERPLQPSPSRRLEDGNNQDDDKEPDYGSFPFDPTPYAIKYAGCAAINMYSDEMAENEEYPTFLEQKSFVAFRLCPTEYCQDSYEKGCDFGYGEYMVSLEVYLEEFQRYAEEVFEQYCEYCAQCMYFEKYFYGNRDRKLDGENYNMDELEDEYGYDDDNASNQQHACKYYDACYTYADVCDVAEEEDDDGNGNNNNNQDDDDVVEFEYQELFECREVDYGDDDGYQYFVGPHCASDKKTITIDLFDDEFCSNYIGDKVDIVSITGMQIESDGLSQYYDGECIPCLESDLKYMVGDMEGQDQEDEDEIVELCDGLFEQAARCEKNLDDGSGAAFRTDDLTCSFISNVLTGQYDENGFLYIDADEYAKDNEYNVFSVKTEKVSAGQTAGLVVLGLGCFALIGCAVWLHKGLITAKSEPLTGWTQKPSDWRPNPVV